MKLLYFQIYVFIIMNISFQFISCDDPALKINLNPPEENVKDTIEALKDIDKLENDLRIGLNEDFDDEKKKLIEIQKARVHDIVHGAFIALKSLIPNPVKASIRKAIRDHLNGKGAEDSAADPSKSMKAVDPSETVSKINSLQQNINNLSKFKEKNVKFYEGDEKTNLKRKNNLRFKSQYDSIINEIIKANSRDIGYSYPSNDQETLNAEYNSELYSTNFPVMKPL